jgi:hypothetical protein
VGFTFGHIWDKCTPTPLLEEFKGSSSFPITLITIRARGIGSLNLGDRNSMLHRVDMLESTTIRVCRLDACDRSFASCTQFRLPIDTFRIIACYNFQNREISLKRRSQVSDLKLAGGWFEACQRYGVCMYIRGVYIPPPYLYELCSHFLQRFQLIYTS